MSVTLEPDFARGYMCRGSLYMLKGDKKLADEDFKKVIRLDSIPEEADCSYYAYYYLGDKNKAIEILNKVTMFATANRATGSLPPCGV